jgi:tetratricopeptide (TPR) repeat protein
MVGYDLLDLTEIFNLCESPSVPFNPDNSQSQRRLGEQLYKIGLYDRAAEALERAVKLDPGHVAVETHEALGDTYRMLRNHEKALEAYKRALGLRPESAGLFLKLGSLYSESGRLPEAIEAYRQALRFAPTGDTAHQAQASIGYIYKGQGRFADAAKAFEEVLRAYPNDYFTRYSLSETYLELGDMSSALEQHKILKDLKSNYADDLHIMIYQHAVRQNPDDPDAHFNLGNAYYSAERYADAIDPYKQAVRLKPDLELAYSRLGYAYTQLRQYEPAIQAFEAAIRLNPREHIDRVNAGLAYFYIGKSSQAIAHLKEATRLKPDSADAHNNLGYVLRSTGADREAILSLKQAIRLNPDHEPAHYNLGVAYQNLGEYKEAVEALRQAARLKPSNPDSHFQLGQVYAHLGRYQEAVEAFKEAIALKPYFIDARFQLGSAYFRMGHHEAALKEYDDLKGWDEKRAEELYSLIRNPASRLAGPAVSTPAEPPVTLSVPAACSDVYRQVFTDLDPSWSVTVLPPRDDVRLPMPKVLNAFLAAVPGLESATAKFDALDKDMFYMRVHYLFSLAQLQKEYPKMDKGLLWAAKLRACRDTMAN